VKWRDIDTEASFGLFCPRASSLFRAYRHFMLAKDHAARSARFPIDTRHFMMMK